jgi:peptide methionine sulfoxide reductase MsrB
MKDDATLKEENPELYEVAWKGATEAPFMGKYEQNDK